MSHTAEEAEQEMFICFLVTDKRRTGNLLDDVVRDLQTLQAQTLQQPAAADDALQS